MNHPNIPFCRPIVGRIATFVCTLLLAFASPAIFAQTASGTGSISGRILNPATGEYVRNVEVSIRGTALTAISADDGSYRITGVPAGDAVVVVNYTGSAASAATVRVTAGQNSTRD